MGLVLQQEVMKNILVVFTRILEKELAFSAFLKTKKSIADMKANGGLECDMESKLYTKQIGFITGFG